MKMLVQTALGWRRKGGFVSVVDVDASDHS